MTIEIFVTLLVIFSVITSLFTECLKKIMLKDVGIKYPSNIIAIIIAFLVGLSGMTIFYIYNEIPLTFTNTLSSVLMAIATAVGSMVGYDKVIQAIDQMEKFNDDIIKLLK